MGPICVAPRSAPRFSLAAPATVDLSTRTCVPLFALTAFRTDAPLPLEALGVIVATRLDGNATFAVTWSAWKDPGDDKPVPRDPMEPVGFVVCPFERDLRARLPEIPWRPGTLVIRALLGEKFTAPVRVAFTAGAVGDDPDVRTYLDWVGAQQPVATTALSTSLPMDYRRDEWTPKPPRSRASRSRFKR